MTAIFLLIASMPSVHDLTISNHPSPQETSQSSRVNGQSFSIISKLSWFIAVFPMRPKHRRYAYRILSTIVVNCQAYRCPCMYVKTPEQHSEKKMQLGGMGG